MAKKNERVNQSLNHAGQDQEYVGWTKKRMFIAFPPDQVELKAGEARPQLDLVTDLSENPAAMSRRIN